MKNNIENGIYIPDENRELHPLDEWTKREDPTTAQTVVLVTDSGMLEIANEDLPGKFNFKVAQKAAAEYREGFPLRNPPRGGRNVRRPVPGPRRSVQEDRRRARYNTYWTSEADPDPEYNSNGAVFLRRQHGQLVLQPQVQHTRRASGL
jgi:hypothetical protein